MATLSQFPDSDEALDALRAVWEKDSNRLMYHVRRGLEGYNEGFSNGMKRLNQYIYGTHRGRYYLIGADSGIGKTTLADFMFFYHLWKAAKAKGIRLSLDYYSFELPLTMKKARMVSMIYWIKYKEEMPAQHALSMIPGLRPSTEEQKKIMQVLLEVEEIFDSIHFVEGTRTPTQMWARMLQRAELHGEVIRATGEHGLTSITGYKPNEDNVFKMSIIDHLGLIEPEGGQSIKQAMDLASTFLVRARNLFGDSAAVIQQFNTSMQGNARENKNPMAYVPARVDFGDTRYTYRDADVVLGLTRPVDFQLNSFGPFSELERWGNYFIVNFLLKNRYGPIAGGIPYFIDPIAGIPEELPEGKDWNLITQELYIEKAEKQDELCRLYYPK